jgi:hypothetical protein
VLGGVDGTGDLGRDQPGTGQDVVADRVPEGACDKPSRRQVEILDPEHLAREEVLALEGDHLLGDLDSAQRQPGAAHGDGVVGRDDADVRIGACLGVLVRLARRDDRSAIIEVERRDSVLLALVEVKGAGVHQREGAVLVDGADQPCVAVDDAVVRRGAGAQSDARRRRALAGVEGAASPHTQPVVDDQLPDGVLDHAVAEVGPEPLVIRNEGLLVRGTRHMGQ